LRWNGEPVCPHCGHEKSYKFKDQKTYKCAKCRKKYNATVGTIFENTKIPLCKWFWAIYIATSHKKGISSLQLAKDIAVTQKTAWFILHRIREMLKSNAPEMLTGAVELDETYVGGKSINWHADKRKKMREAGTGYIHKTPVFGLLQRGGNVHTEMPKEATGRYLKPIILDKVKPGTVVMTDGFGAYYGLNEIYQHVVVNHQLGQYVVGEWHTNSIENFWSLLKRGVIGIYHYVSPKHLHRYCNEFAFRYNTRKVSETERFNIAVASVNGKRVRYSELTA